MKRNTKLTNILCQQAEAHKHLQSDMQCEGAGREGGWERVMEEDFKLTPLWIFPNTAYYNNIVSLKCGIFLKVKSR